MGSLARSIILALLVLAPAHAWARLRIPCLILRLKSATQEKSSNRLELSFYRKESGHFRFARGTLRITPQNIEELFTYELGGGAMGAKGLGYIDSNGGLNFGFWKVGVGKAPLNVHHRDVLANLLELEAERIEKGTKPWNPKRAAAREEQWFHYADSASKLTDERIQSAFPEDVLRRAQGFQLTAERQRPGAPLKVTLLDVDSSVTSAQARSGRKLSAKQMAFMINQALNRISPEARALRAIRVIHLSELNLDRRELASELRKLGIKTQLKEL